MDIISRIVFDDSEAIRAMENHIKTVDKISKSYDDLTDDQTSALKTAAGGFDDVNKSIKTYEKNIGDAAKESRDATKSITDLTGDIKFLGVNLSDGVRNIKQYVAGLKSYVASMRASATATVGLSNALKVLKTALISTGIGAIIVALGTLATFLTKVQAGLDIVNKLTTQLGSTFDVLTGRLGKLFSGDFSGAFEKLGEEIQTTWTRAGQLADALQRINRALIDQEVATSESRKQIAEFKKIYEDTTQSFGDRINAATRAGEIEQRNIDNTVELLRQRLDAERELADVGELNDEERRRIADLEIELNDAILESTEKQTEIQNTLNGLIREQIEARREQLDFVRALGRELADLETIDILGSESDDDTQRRIDAARTSLTELLTDYRRQLEDFNTDIARRRDDGLFVDDALVNATTSRLEQIIADINTGLDNLSGREPVTVDVLPSVTPDALDVPEIEIDVQFTPGSTTSDDIRSLADAFELLQRAATAFGEVSREISDFVVEGIEQQLDAELAILDAIRERTGVIETELEREIALRDEGRANAVESKRRELTELRLLESESEERARDIRRRQLNAQLLADSASQLSNLATAATGFFSANANIPIVGIGFAVAAISTMFSILAGIRARSKALQESFSEGGFVGRPGTSWSSDRYGRGHRVEHSNVVLGGDEYVINGRTTQLQRAFLDDLNSGMYNNVDIGSVLQGFQRRDGIANRRQGRRNAELVRESMMLAVGAHTDRLIKHMNTAKHMIAVDPGQKIVTYDNKGNRETTTFRG